MRVLITRPHEDAKRLALTLAKQDIDVVSAPLLDIVFSDAESLDLEGVQAILFTSVNGVRAFVQNVTDRSKPVLCVGDATAREASFENFSNVKSAKGDVKSLAQLVKDELDPTRGALLHPAGTHVAGALGLDVEQSGFVYRRDVLYTAHKAETLPKAACSALKENGVDGVLFYSPRTAAAFLKLVKQADLDHTLSSVTAYCLSSAVADVIAQLRWAEIKIAPEPTQDALLALL